ncbi:hypothetical protein GH714_022791 [Hevea brasiliensis]|uniref:Uncharacterized protein n=1 Tax=Hevea brasiliensis TaxID=3981 RepID=A0A6A6NIT5_HEVBR|nr:hypothetical protein GH714_022791 [Hevea brasiliensis]
MESASSPSTRHLFFTSRCTAPGLHAIPYSLHYPQVDFDCDFDDDEGGYEYDDGGRRSFMKGGEEEYEERIPEEEKEIDLRAEEFIAKFYEQMKLQRQIRDHFFVKEDSCGIL